MIPLLLIDITYPPTYHWCSCDRNVASVATLMICNRYLDASSTIPTDMGNRTAKASTTPVERPEKDDAPEVVNVVTSEPRVKRAALKTPPETGTIRGILKKAILLTMENSNVMDDVILLHIESNGIQKLALNPKFACRLLGIDEEDEEALREELKERTGKAVELLVEYRIEGKTEYLDKTSNVIRKHESTSTSITEWYDGDGVIADAITTRIRADILGVDPMELVKQLHVTL